MVKKPVKKKSQKKKPRKKGKPRVEAEKKKAPVKKEVPAVAESKEKPERYFEAVGRRKTAIARVRLWTRGEKKILVNNKEFENYFPAFELQQIATDSLRKMNCLDKFSIQVLVRGGGFHAQAEALRHAIARALVKFNADFRKRLKKSGYLTRDPRMRERKKFGLKRARKAPQWQKR